MRRSTKARSKTSWRTGSRGNRNNRAVLASGANIQSGTLIKSVLRLLDQEVVDAVMLMVPTTNTVWPTSGWNG